MKKEVLGRNFSEKQVKDSYSKVAWFYNFWSWLTESKAAARVIESASIQDGERILEVAVGTGLVIEKIIKRNPHGVNEGVDLSPSMLLRAEKRLKKFNKNMYHLQTGNAFHLPFDDNSFNLVVNNFMIDLLPENDFDKVLAEFFRVLKPSGRMVISAMAFGEKWYNRIWHWVARQFPSLLTGCRPISLSNYLLKTGFTDIGVEQISQNTFPAEVLCAKK